MRNRVTLTGLFLGATMPLHGVACGGHGTAGQDAGEAGPTIDFVTYQGDVVGPAAIVAAQDGDGEWRVLPYADGRYRVPATDRYTIAVACQSQSPTVAYLLATVDELPAPSWICALPDPAPASGTLYVSVTGMVDLEYASAYSKGGAGYRLETDPPAFQLQVPPGMRDAGVVVFEAGAGTTDEISKEALVRDVSVPGGAGTYESVTVDVSGDGLSPERHNVTLNGQPTEVWWWYRGADGGELLYGDRATGYAVPPVGARRDSDFLKVTVSTLVGDVPWGIDNYSSEYTDLQFNTPSDALSGLIVSPYPSSSAYSLLSWGIDSVEGAAAYSGKATNNSLYDEVDWFATPGWFGGSSRIEWTMPDLSGLDGWTAAVAPPAGPWNETIVFADVSDDLTALLKSRLVPESLLTSGDLVGLTVSSTYIKGAVKSP